MNNTYVVIMAGGVGSRFWPFSTTEKPKQFLDILGLGKSLIRMTFERFAKSIAHENIFVLTNSNYADMVQEQLPELGKSQILCEPMMKNTAPCVLYAALKIHQLNPQAKLVVVPSDQLILQNDLFIQTIETALEETDNDQLLTIGIRPTRPDTGYGYIEFDKAENMGDVKTVKQFREKPNAELAAEFLASGNFVWNAGIFIWKTETLLQAFQSFKPELYNLFASEVRFYNSNEEQNYVNTCFAACESISIDYAILEKAQNVRVVQATFDWSDLGTWGSVYTHLPKDAAQNGRIGKIYTENTSNSVIRISDYKEAIVVGLDDYIVIEANNRLLIAPKKEEQSIKEWVSKLK